MTTVNENRLAMIKALRSDEFDQTRHMLMDADGFCCIGVGLVALRDKFMLRCINLGLDNNSRESYRVWQQAIDADKALKNTLVDMNDDGRSFEEIADYLEDFWGLGDTEEINRG